MTTETRQPVICGCRAMTAPDTKAIREKMEEMNAVKCPCGGTDEMCPCQNKLHAISTVKAAEMPRAWRDVMDERVRQTTVEGWTPEHDGEHDEGELAAAAGSYAINAACMLSPYDGVPRDELPDTWPPEWDVKWWKPSPDNPRRDLVKAGALILAEIERLDRAALAAM